MGKEYKLTQAGADMVGGHVGGTITPREDRHRICAEGERCFSVDAEGAYNPDDIQCHVGLDSSMYTVTESIQ